MKISHLSAECMPFAKTGGLGDVTAALPRAQAAAGDDVDIWLPFHQPAAEWYRRQGTWPELGCPPFRIDIMGQSYEVGILRGRLPASEVPVYFVAHDPFFQRGPIYAPDHTGHDDGLWRFALFVRAAVTAMKHLGRRPQILHCHDWHPALAPMLGAWSNYRDRWFDEVASVLTIHNLHHQGSYDPSLFPALGLPLETMPLVTENGRVNLLKGAIVAADMITTVSPTYAWEIKTREGGAGLDEVLRDRVDRLVGILNGIDPSEWNPARDPHLAARYSAKDSAGKIGCRRALCEAAGFSAEDPGMILGAIGRLTEQKGFDVLLDAVPQLLHEGTRIVMLGSGDQKLEQRMLGYARHNPGRFQAWLGYDEARAHAIEAGADSFIMPSRFEPCGLNQMYSLAYGTPPIVRRTGGLADTVIGYHGHNLDTANGFSFDDLTPGAIVGTVAWARSALASSIWPRLVYNAMHADFSWQRAAEHYQTVYRQARTHRGLDW
ncbi:glycogen synthase [Haliangium sp. UPWRP_2]|uniref:glycogen synthase n=1 Tax=Haliangium sp. UPWRP_2 TaxID=1931276 RepID=UPI000B546779|nr:glycogen synthase [Haliangium sp. UPWRP_2]PSM31349.1 glycogen synthase [Haliangium sp. UPWRP_2]